MSLRHLLAAAAACFTVGFGSIANAGPVTGEISMVGYVSTVGSVAVSEATGLDFIGGITDYRSGTGSFAGLTCSSSVTSCGSVKDLNSFIDTGPISQFLTFKVANAADITFDLTSITEIDRLPGVGGGSLDLVADGVIHFSGYDDTAGTFLLSTQGNQVTSFSATTLAANSVPEPMSIALLGGSLIAFGLIRAKRT